jgi:4-hydroxythreonine-4-phosphate dehydrogenase
MGDPAGIGPEVALKALASPKVKGLADFLFIGDRSVLSRTEKTVGIKLKASFLDLANVSASGFAYGRQLPAFGRASVQYLDRALVKIALGEACAIVTAPINKAAVRSSGPKNFLGHTEYLAEKTGTKDYAMMFVGEKLKITLVTRHIPLSQVPRSVTSEAVFKTIMMTRAFLRQRFGIRNPKIAVSGLNPHAGEHGSFGDEETRIIAPAIKRASRSIGGVIGPVPSDVMFHEAMGGKFDACVAMYHDQALGAFKLLYFKTGVNVTLGLPFVRTSPDHGTGFDIAGKGVADPSSMIEAIRLACRLSRC